MKRLLSKSTLFLAIIVVFGLALVSGAGAAEGWYFWGQNAKAHGPTDRFGPYTTQDQCRADEDVVLAQDPHNEIYKDCELTGGGFNHMPDTPPHYPAGSVFTPPPPDAD